MNTNTNTVTVTDTKVIVTGAGRHFHLFNDCRAMAQGQRNSDKFGRNLHTVTLKSVPRSEVIDDGMFGCRECYKRANLTIPADADRVAIYAQRKAARDAARTAKAEVAAAKAAAKAAKVVEITPVIEATTMVEPAPVLDQDLDALIAMIVAFLAQFNLTVASAA